MKKIQMFTDGSCLKNPDGPGGWCCILSYQGRERVLRGGEPSTTNNRMEIMAVLKGLQALKEPCEIELCSDSQYVLNAIKDWIHGWARNGWKTASKQDVANKDLWEVMLEHIRRHTIKTIWVRGHTGHPENERCDHIAKIEAQRFA